MTIQDTGTGIASEHLPHIFDRFRQVEPRLKVPAIALTAYARAEDAERALRAGYQQHLAKPVDPSKLLQTIKDWVNPEEREPRS